MDPKVKMRLQWVQLAEVNPSWEQVIAAYDPTKEQLRDVYYLRDIGRPKKAIRL